MRVCAPWAGSNRPTENKPAIRERIEQALDPISKAIPLSPADVSRTRAWLIQAGFRDAIHVNYYFGARLLLAGVGFAAVALFSGFDNLFLLAGIPGLGFFLPRFLLKRMIRDRQQRIRSACPMPSISPSFASKPDWRSIRP